MWSQNSWKVVAAGAGSVRKTSDGDDAEHAAAGSPQRPEQLLVAFLVAVDDAAVGQDDLCAEQLIGREPVRAAEDPEPAAERQARDADGRPAPGGDRQAVLRRARRRRAPSRAPAPTVITPSAIDTESIGDTSMTMPSVLERPAKQWPPLRGATRRPYRPANQIASATSVAVRHRTTACGRGVVEPGDRRLARLVVAG